MKHLHIFCIAGLLFNCIQVEASKHKRIGLAAIVHKSNAPRHVELSELSGIPLGDIRQTGNRRRVTVVRLASGSEADQAPMELVMGMTGAEYRRLFLNQEFRGREVVPSKILNSPDSAFACVPHVPGVIGFVEATSTLAPACASQVKVLLVSTKLPEQAGYLLQ